MAKRTTRDDRREQRRKPDAWRVDSQDGDRETIGDETFVFVAALADRACHFFEWFLTHVEGEWAGRAFELEWWQRAIVRCVFGWVNERTGLRRYRSVFLFLPRKNGKSTLAAGLALYLLVADDEPGAQVYSAASDKEQATIVFTMAKKMVAQSAELTSRTTTFKSSIAHHESGSLYKVISSDAGTKHGYNAHGAVIDELHAHKNRDLFDVLTTSMGARREPLAVITTTAGYDRQSVCFEQYQYAVKVDRGEVVDPTYLPVLFEIKPGEDWQDERVWERVNPNLGITIKREFLRAEFAKAREVPRYEHTVRRLYLNEWTQQKTRWLSPALWKRNIGESRTPQWWRALRRRECYIGIDLSSTRDLTAMVMVFPNAERNRFIVVPRFWLPGETAIERSRNDKVSYVQWINEGHITETEGSATDQSAIRLAVQRAGELYDVREVAVDRWEATRLIGELEDDGFVAFAHGQGFASMSEPSKALERCLLAQQIEHGGNPVLEWNATNAAVSTDPAGNIKPAKDRSADRIDGLVATVMALGRAMLVRDVKADQSVYKRQNRGIEVIGHAEDF